MDDGAGVEITYWSGQSMVGTMYVLDCCLIILCDLLVIRGINWFVRLTLLCDYNYVGTEQYELTPGQLTLITVRTEAACPTRVSISGGLIFMLAYVLTATTSYISLA